MSRQMRIEYSGAVYHVIARGNGKADIYSDNEDRKKFIELLSKSLIRNNIRCHSFCLMSNHYHLLLETPDANLSSGLHLLNSEYAQYFNRRHDRSGHLFQGRYKAIVVQRDLYLLELCRYIVMNPVRAGLVNHPSRYKWSSYRTIIGATDRFSDFLESEWVLSQFASNTFSARREYTKFVMQGVDRNMIEDAVAADLIMGDKDFIESMKSHIEKNSQNTAIPRSQRLVGIVSLKELFGDSKCLNKEKRNKLIYHAVIDLGYTRREVSNYLGIHAVTVGRITRSQQNV